MNQNPKIKDSILKKYGKAALHRKVPANKVKHRIEKTSLCNHRYNN